MTRPRARLPAPFLREETIEPGQIGAYKLEAHRDFLENWATERGLDPALLWLVR